MDMARSFSNRIVACRTIPASVSVLCFPMNTDHNIMSIIHKKSKSSNTITNRNLMSKKGSSDVFVSVALGSRDRSFSIWSTDLKRPLIVINDVFDQSVLDLSWSKDGKVRDIHNCPVASLLPRQARGDVLMTSALRGEGGPKICQFCR